MADHIHIDLVSFLVVGFEVLVFINLWRLASAWLAQRGGLAGKIGTTTGALTHLGN